MTSQPIADLGPLRDQAERQREQKAWYWYDWANSAYYTTVLSVLFAPFMITVAGRAAGCGDDADDTCDKTVEPAGTAPGRRLPAVLPDQLRDHPQRRHPADRRCDGGPVTAQEAAHGRLRVGRCVLRGAAVPDEGRQLAAGGVRDRDEQRARRAAPWSATTRSCATSRPRRSETRSPRAAGPSATSVAVCCSSSTWASCSATTPWASTRSSPSGSRCCPRRSGGRASRSSRSCGSATGPLCTRWRPRVA